MVSKIGYFVSLCVCVLIGLVYSNTDFILKCKVNDRVCTTRSGQVAWPIVANGIPSLGIATSDPLFMKQIKSDQAGLNLEFTNLEARGLKNCKVLDFVLNDVKNTFAFDISCKFDVVGAYNISGRVLILPVTGVGNFKIDLEQLQLHMEGALDKKNKDGKTYWNVVNFRHNSTALAPVKFQFDNLFNGNKQLSDPVHDFANSNYGEVLAELGNPIIEALCKKVMKTVNKLLKYLPDEDFFIH